VRPPRREFLRTLALGAAALGPVSRASAGTAEWRELLAAARKDGKVVVNTFPGDGYKRVMKAFSQAFPEIKLEHTGLHSQDFAPRMLQERKAGLFTWDVATIPTSTALQVLRPAGVWDPVRPAIILPDVKDDAGWDGGFARGFSVVKDRALTYGFVAARASGIAVNVDLVKDAPLRSLTDLLDPRWKGKLLLPDVRVMGDAFWPMTNARLTLGDDVIKRLYVDQEPVLSRDTRQIAEFMVRGRYPIALAVNPLLLGQFQKQGLGKNIKLMHLPEIDVVSFSSTLWLVNRAPHPAAAKLFANWLLTKEAQGHWAHEVEQNSRRIGVEPGNPHLLPPKGAKLFQVDAEENLPEVVKTQDIAKAVIK
jgi:iron(III) transport system substrate-binding protein